MPTKLISIAAVLIVMAPLSAAAEAPGHRTVQSRIDDYNACTTNGGDMSVCCAIAGGTYDPPHTVTSTSGHPVTVESCLIERVAIQHTIGGKTAVIKAPGATSRAP